MKLSDVEIGGRYRAKVSGQMVTVRVTEIRDSASFGRSKTVIYAVNETTGRQIVIRSPRRLRSRVG